MSWMVEQVRAFNRWFPWNQPKRSLVKWAYRRMLKPEGVALCERVEGDLKMRLDLSDPYERGIYFNVNNMVVVPLLRRLLRPGDTFVDAGANLGLLALVAARAVGPTGRVFAFEPQPGVVARLEDAVALNRFGDRVEVVAKGCWSGPGEATFNVYDDIDAGSMGDVEGKGDGRSVTIETTDMDSVVSGHARVVKIDVEGAELEAIRGARRLLFAEPHPHIILELNGSTAEAFGYHPMDLVDEILAARPGDRMHFITSKHRHRVDRGQVAERLARKGRKPVNVWFEPA